MRRSPCLSERSLSAVSTICSYLSALNPVCGDTVCLRSFLEYPDAHTHGIERLQDGLGREAILAVLFFCQYDVVTVRVLSFLFCSSSLIFLQSVPVRLMAPIAVLLRKRSQLRRGLFWTFRKSASKRMRPPRDRG